MRSRAAGLLSCVVLVGCGATQSTGASSDPARLQVEIEELTFGVAGEGVREAVAQSVAARARTQHMDLPPAEVAESVDPDAWPHVTVANETAHGLVVWVSGPCARTIALPPQSQNSVEVCEGSYQVAGQVVNGNFLPLVGTPDTFLNGARYRFSFYVQSNPYQRRVRRR
ncbi:MAG: hypothetical protein AB8I08_26960 [Sandaracinaceae bacterium]